MAARPLTSRVEGPLAGFAVGCESWLAAKGICRAIRDRIWEFWYLSEWLESRGLPVGDLDRHHAEEHLAERRDLAGYAHADELRPMSGTQASRPSDSSAAPRRSVLPRRSVAV